MDKKIDWDKFINYYGSNLRNYIFDYMDSNNKRIPEIKETARFIIYEVLIKYQYIGKRDVTDEFMKNFLPGMINRFNYYVSKYPEHEREVYEKEHIKELKKNWVSKYLPIAIQQRLYLMLFNEEEIETYFKEKLNAEAPACNYIINENALKNNCRDYIFYDHSDPTLNKMVEIYFPDINKIEPEKYNIFN